jgi:secreted PhoX family phosphatase
MPPTRRSVLTGSAAAGVGIAVAGSVPSLAQATSARGGPGAAGSHVPFPPLVDDPAGILALPEGFSYAIITRTGSTKLDHGHGLTPADHDGMAVFSAPRGRYTLIHNHEIDPGARFGVPHVEGTVYDPGAIRGRLHRHHHRALGPQPRRVRRPVRDRIELRRRPDTTGHLAHSHRTPGHWPRCRSFWTAARSCPTWRI